MEILGFRTLKKPKRSKKFQIEKSILNGKKKKRASQDDGGSRSSSLMQQHTINRIPFVLGPAVQQSSVFEKHLLTSSRQCSGMGVSFFLNRTYYNTFEFYKDGASERSLRDNKRGISRCWIQKLEAFFPTATQPLLDVKSML